MIEEVTFGEQSARLLARASCALGTETEAVAFLTAPHPMLETTATELGVQRVERILNALEYGLAL